MGGPSNCKRARQFTGASIISYSPQHVCIFCMQVTAIRRMGDCPYWQILCSWALDQTPMITDEMCSTLTCKEGPRRTSQGNHRLFTDTSTRSWTSGIEGIASPCQTKATTWMAWSEGQDHFDPGPGAWTERPTQFQAGLQTVWASMIWQYVLVLYLAKNNCSLSLSKCVATSTIPTLAHGAKHHQTNLLFQCS